MNRIIIMAGLVIGAIARCMAQSTEDFRAFARAEKTDMLKAYARKDMVSFRRHLDGVVNAFNALSDEDKKKNSWEQWSIKEEYYLMADLYALSGDRNNAIAYLKKSKNYDYNDLKDDHDLDRIRKDPRFIALADSAKKANPDFLTVLRTAAGYNATEKSELPAFTYQSPGDANLKALKAAYNLDSIAGKGNDVSQIINLMEWVHYLIPHDGSKGNPAVKNAMSLIKECRRDNKTLNCRGLAIVLNEVYLAEGFKSRFVTCLPKDTTDQDCHVITMVWSKSLKKWLWMDPTFMAYVMNEKGELLSIEEVRERLIGNKPLILNPDANRNHATSQTKDDYLDYYMAKNLYKLQCPVSSEYDYETSGNGKEKTYIELLPGSVKPATKRTANEHGVGRPTVYYTSNAHTFWAPPGGVKPDGGSTGRTIADYERAMEQFKNFYNEQNAEGINQMFVNPDEIKSFMDKKDLERLAKDFGKIISVKYMGMEQGSDVALFKMVCEKSVHAMGISLDENNKLGTFRFATSSPYIDKLLAKEL